MLKSTYHCQCVQKYKYQNPKRFIEEIHVIEVKVWFLKFIIEAVLSALSEVFL